MKSSPLNSNYGAAPSGKLPSMEKPGGQIPESAKALAHGILAEELTSSEKLLVPHATSHDGHANTPPEPTVTVKGKLFTWAETGTEGAYWALQDERHPQSYDGLNVIEEGDHLTILDQQNKILWAGVIIKDTSTGAVPRPGNPRYTQQVALGWWVHWIQRGFEPDPWADFFDRTGDDAYYGILLKKADPNVDPVVPL